MVRAIIVVAAYIAAQMMADITSLKIITLGGLSMDAGTFVYPLTFTLRDLVHKTLGITAARTLIITAAVINLIMAGLFWFVAKLPGDPQVGPQLEFAAVLAPVWRIVIASIIAEVVAELIDTEAYRIWVERHGQNHQWARVLVSNGFSVPIDSIIFSFIAFYGAMPLGVVFGIILSNILVKGVTTLVSLPLIYTVPERRIELTLEEP
jgi:uncharacterized integral membrane protein (TIGR00697 family)